VSLRDQLLAKGLVSNKRAKQLDRESKQKRKNDQGHRQKARAVEAAAAAAAQAEQDALRQTRDEARRVATLTRKAQELQGRARQLALGNQIRSRGPVRYHFRDLDGRTVRFVELHPRVAWKLRAGEAAIVAVRWSDREPDYTVVNAGAARELQDLDPSLICSFVTDTHGISAPDEAFVEPDWPVSLAPHRAMADEVQAMREVDGVRRPGSGRSTGRRSG
jgi:uncharacterized protein YaiL (DUF2058 family)